MKIWSTMSKFLYHICEEICFYSVSWITVYVSIIVVIYECIINVLIRVIINLIRKPGGLKCWKDVVFLISYHYSKKQETNCGVWICLLLFLISSHHFHELIKINSSRSIGVNFSNYAIQICVRCVNDRNLMYVSIYYLSFQLKISIRTWWG